MSRCARVCAGQESTAATRTATGGERTAVHCSFCCCSHVLLVLLLKALPDSSKALIEDAASNFSVGWSHGKVRRPIPDPMRDNALEQRWHLQVLFWDCRNAGGIGGRSKGHVQR